jgi:hypothetical protein
MGVEWSEVVVTIVLQVGIAWEAVFDLFNQNIGDLWEAFVKWQLNQLADEFLGKSGLFEVLLRTPSPRMKGGGIIFGTPDDAVWNHLKVLYWERFLPVGYLALFLSVMVSNFGKAWGLGVGKQKQRQLGLVIGLFLIPGAWYLAIAYLNLIELFSLGISPPLGDLQDAVVDSLSVIVSTDVGYASVVGATSIIAFLLALLVNLMRLVAIWVIVPTLPLIIGFDLGEFPVLGNFSRRAYTMFAVLAAVPIPVAIGARIIFSFYKIASKGGDVFIDTLANTVLVIVIPTLAVMVPVYVFMQAADYATIRGATAALSIIGKPAALATSGGSWAASQTLGNVKKRFTGGRGNSNGGDGGGGGGGGSGDSGPRPSMGDSGHDDSGPYPGRGQASETGWGGLPKRRPSGARPDTRGGPKPNPASDVDASGWKPGGNQSGQSSASGTDSAPPALPGFQHTHRASAYPETTAEQADAAGDPLVGDAARADYVAGGPARSDVDYVSDGQIVDPEASFATPTDRAFARSQVIASGMASPYYRSQASESSSADLTAARSTESDSATSGNTEREVKVSEARTVSTDDDRGEPEIVDNAAARARRRRGEMRDPTERSEYKERRRRQRRQRDRYYGDGDD